MLPKVKFRQWYVQYRPLLVSALRDNCQSEYTTYLQGNATFTHGFVLDNVACALVQDCIWNNVEPHIQLDMQSAQVLLGITPTIVSQLSSSLEEMSLIAIHQPLLFVLLALSSPAIYPPKLFGTEGPLAVLEKENELSHLATSLNGSIRWPFLLGEYTLAAAAALNIIWLAYDFSMRTCLSWGCNSYFHPLIWSLVPLLIYGSFAVGFAYRVRLMPLGDPGQTQAALGSHVWWRMLFCHGNKNKKNMVVQWKGFNKSYIVLKMAAIICCVLDLAYGTFVFSASNFIGSVDALKIIARVMASAIAARIIVAIELARVKRHAATEHGGLSSTTKSYA